MFVVNCDNIHISLSPARQTDAEMVFFYYAIEVHQEEYNFSRIKLPGIAFSIGFFKPMCTRTDV